MGYVDPRNFPNGKGRNARSALPQAHFIGTGIRLAPPGGVFGHKRITALELRYGHYLRTTRVTANIITLPVKREQIGCIDHLIRCRLSDYGYTIPQSEQVQ